MNDKTTKKPIAIKNENFMKNTNIKHAFFTRQGGVSKGIYESLNVGFGSQDDQECIKENRRRICEAIGINETQLITVHQIHSNKCVFVKENFQGEKPKCDAMVSNEKNLALGIITADCCPILLADPNAGIIAAAHAGWKGAMQNISEQTIKIMEKNGANRKNINALLGPTIQQENYEVSKEFFDQFINQNTENKQFFQNKENNKFQFNLPQYIAKNLEKSGVAEVSEIKKCTYPKKNNLFSNRRAYHKKQKDYGRQMALIIIKE